MKKLSIKLKITLWYTLVMALVSGIALVIMTSANRDLLERDIAGRVEKTVMECARRINGPNGLQTNVPRFGLYSQGVHMVICDDDNNTISGTILFDIDTPIELLDHQLLMINEKGNKYCIYTTKVRHRNGTETPYWVKGVMSVTDEMYAVHSAAKANSILTVILIIIAAAGGYFIIGRALSPVSKIRNTAQRIIEGSDLSERIRIGKGKDEIHSLANTFDIMLDKIEQTVEREKQFTSDASHELRTPVAVILSECEYMTDCTQSPEETKESVYSIKAQAEKMSKLITELLTISRMDKNTLQTEFEETDISELLNFICDEQEEIHTENIKLYRSIEDGIVAEADRFLLARLFINLISNAYSYGKDGGNISVSLHRSNGRICASIADDGIGIAPEHIDKIWERFYQVDPSRTANENGSMGLGLSMVEWIAKCHNGHVSVESTPGVGSIFTLVL